MWVPYRHGKRSGVRIEAERLRFPRKLQRVVADAEKAAAPMPDAAAAAVAPLVVAAAAAERRDSIEADPREGAEVRCYEPAGHPGKTSNKRKRMND